MPRKLVLVVALLVILLPLPTSRADSQVTLDLGDVTLAGGLQTGHFPQVWDLTAGDLVLRFTYDATGIDDADFRVSAQLGLRTCGYYDFDPTWSAEGAGIWVAAGLEFRENTLDPDPPDNPIADLDDKLFLKKRGEGSYHDYDLPYVMPPEPVAKHAVWFDRDGVDPWQAEMWGYKDGVTYNTHGIYEIVVTLHATGDSTGEAYMTVNGEPQGFYDPVCHPGEVDVSPMGMTFSGDTKRLQVFYGLKGEDAPQTIAFEDITVTGYLAEDQGDCPVPSRGSVRGWGRFTPDEDTLLGLEPGNKVAFGMMLRQRRKRIFGRLRLLCRDDRFAFTSSHFERLAIYKGLALVWGKGSLNGRSGYKFLLWAYDGDIVGGADRFSIRIWRGSDNQYPPVYRAEGTLESGQIMVRWR